MQTGTTPKNSQWTRNPIPACVTRTNGGGGARSPCVMPQFPPPIPNLYGWFGVSFSLSSPELSAKLSAVTHELSLLACVGQDNAPTWSKPFFPGPPTNEISLKSRNGKSPDRKSRQGVSKR